MDCELCTYSQSNDAKMAPKSIKGCVAAGVGKCKVAF